MPAETRLVPTFNVCGLAYKGRDRFSWFVDVPDCLWKGCEITAWMCLLVREGPNVVPTQVVMKMWNSIQIRQFPSKGLYCKEQFKGNV